MTGVEIAIIASIAAGTTAAVSAHQTGKAQERSAKANAEFNAAVARDEANQKAVAGRIEAEKIRRQRIKLAGAQQVGFAKAGVTTEGTPIDLMIQSAEEEELNAQRVQHGFEVGAAASRSQASIFDFKKRQASSFKRAGNIQAGASLLSGISQAASIKAKAGA